MKLLTNSARRKFGTCPRAYYFGYVLMRRPNSDAKSLHFGTEMHKLLEAWWLGGSEALKTMLSEMMDDPDDPYFLPTLRALAIGYDNLYSKEKDKFKTIATEKFYSAPLINPETGAPSKTWALAGKIDALAEDDDKKIIVEHKTTSEDISPASDYWLRLRIDGQISGYYLGARSMEIDVQNCLYDVIRKPSMRPAKATPEDKRKYKADGTLYANQRAEDERPEEWEARLSADIAADPSKYFARQMAARTDDDMQEYLYDMWACGREIADAERLGRWPRRPNACVGFGQCEYFPVCSGCAQINDDTLYKKVDDQNQELKEVQK